MTNDFCILCAKKDNSVYYVANTDPIIWNPDIRNAKPYHTRYSAECDVLRNYENYNYFKKMINTGNITDISLIEFRNNQESGRTLLL